MQLHYILSLLESQALAPIERKSGVFSAYCPVCSNPQDRKPKKTLGIFPHNAKYGTYLTCFRKCSYKEIKAALGINDNADGVDSQTVRIKNDAEREAEKRQSENATAKIAFDRWQQAKPANPGHWYLQQKQIPPLGIRQSLQTLLIPVRNSAGELRNLQMIQHPADGYKNNKQYLQGGQTKGCYWSHGDPRQCIGIAEGYASILSVSLAFRGGLVAALDANNLKIVAELMRQKFPTSRIVLFADDDVKNERKTGVNTGVDACRQIAPLINAEVIIPKFPANRTIEHSDFNDLLVIAGIDELRKQIGGI